MMKWAFMLIGSSRALVLREVPMGGGSGLMAPGGMGAGGGFEAGIYGPAALAAPFAAAQQSGVAGHAHAMSSSEHAAKSAQTAHVRDVRTGASYNLANQARVISINGNADHSRLTVTAREAIALGEINAGARNAKAATEAHRIVTEGNINAKTTAELGAQEAQSIQHVGKIQAEDMMSLAEREKFNAQSAANEAGRATQAQQSNLANCAHNQERAECASREVVAATEKMRMAARYCAGVAAAANGGAHRGHQAEITMGNPVPAKPPQSFEGGKFEHTGSGSFMPGAMAPVPAL